MKALWALLAAVGVVAVAVVGSSNRHHSDDSELSHRASPRVALPARTNGQTSEPASRKASQIRATLCPSRSAIDSTRRLRFELTRKVSRVSFFISENGSTLVRATVSY